MKNPNHSLFLKSEQDHKIAAGTFSAGFKCTFQLYERHSPSASPRIWSFICVMPHWRVLSVSPSLYLMSAPSIGTPRQLVAVSLTHWWWWWTTSRAGEAPPSLAAACWQPPALGSLVLRPSHHRPVPSRRSSCSHRATSALVVTELLPEEEWKLPWGIWHHFWPWGKTIIWY